MCGCGDTALERPLDHGCSQVLAQGLLDLGWGCLHECRVARPVLEEPALESFPSWIRNRLVQVRKSVPGPKGVEDRLNVVPLVLVYWCMGGVERLNV